MQEHMTSLESHIHDMQTEMADEYQEKALIQQDMENKETKIKMLHQEVKMLRQNMLKKDYSMSEMVREFTRMAQMANVKDMEAAIKDAYKAFVIGEGARKKPPKAILASANAPANSPSKLSHPVHSNSPQGKGVPVNDRVARSNTPASPSRGPATLKQQPAQTTPMTKNPVTDESLGYDCKQAVDESVQQMEYMSKTIMTLKASLENAKAKADRVRRDAVAEGSILIEECNKLRKENKLHLLRIRELEHQMYSHREGITSPVRSPMPSLKASSSSPQLTAVNQTCHDLMLDTTLASGSSPSKLVPLATPSKGTRESPARKPNRDGPHAVLPYTKVEQDRMYRHTATARVDEMNAVIMQQKKEIQRLQMQVQLLLSDEEHGAFPNRHEVLFSLY
jgi:hypothetical protein